MFLASNQIIVEILYSETEFGTDPKLNDYIKVLLEICSSIAWLMSCLRAE